MKYWKISLLLQLGLALVCNSAKSTSYRVGEDPTQSICVLYYRTPQGTLTQCGGVLVESQVLMTSGQCFAEGLSGISGTVTVGCGYVFELWGGVHQFKEEFQVDGIRLYSDGMVTQGSDAGKDIALVRLNHAAYEVHPMHLPLNASAFRQEFLVSNLTSSNFSGNDFHLRHGVECRHSWFQGGVGQDQFTLRTEDYTPGFEVKAHLSGHTHENPALILEFWGEKRHSANKLQTGAAFYCREHGAEKWKLFGISSAIQRVNATEVRYDYLTPTFTPQFHTHWWRTLQRWGM